MIRRLVIDGTALTERAISGVASYTRGIVCEIDRLLALPEYADVRVDFYVPFDRIGRVRGLGLKRVQLRRLPLPHLVFGGLVGRGLLPPMDLLLGRGWYFIPRFISWRLWHSPSILTIHDLSYEDVPQFGHDPYIRALQRHVRRSVERSTYVASVTHAMVDRIAEFYGLPPERMLYTPNAADPGRFYPRSEAEIAEVRTMYDLPERYVLSVGNLEPRKNHVALVRAFAALPPASRDGVALVIVGAAMWKSDDLVELVEHVRADGVDVHLLPGVVTDDDLPALYSGAAAFAFVSTYEGFGMPVLEAMQCGVPVIASGIPVLREVGGEAAAYVEPEDDASVTAALARTLALSEEQRLATAAAGTETAKRYTWETAARAVLDAVHGRRTNQWTA